MVITGQFTPLARRWQRPVPVIEIEHINKPHIRTENVVAKVLAARGDHSWLARKLRAAGIDFSLADNAFVRIADFDRTQTLADAMRPDELHRRLDRYAKRFCPMTDVFAQTYHRIG